MTGPTLVITSDASGDGYTALSDLLASGLPIASVTLADGTSWNVVDLLSALLPRAILVLARDPLPADIAAGTIRVAKNTQTGRLSLWANDGGTMTDLLTPTQY